MTDDPTPRRVALVEFPPAGGLFQFAVQLGEALARRGHRVRLLTGPRPELASREPGCTVEPLLPTWHPTAGSDAPEWWRKARRGLRAGQHSAAWLVLLAALRRHPPDVVLWSTWRFPVDAWGVRAVRRLLPQAVLGIVAHEPRPLVEQPGAEGLYKDAGLTARALAAAYGEIDVVYVLGEQTREVFRQTWTTDAPVRVIPHGDESVFRTGPVPPADETEPVVLFFGTVTAYKGLDDLLAAWPDIRAAVPDAQLVIAGSVGADVDARNLAERVAGTAGATLRAGYVPTDAVAGLFGQARVVALPYVRSSQSGVAHLAHTFARPVVTTRVGDIPSVVVDGQRGLVVEPGDRVALAQAVVRLLTHPELAALMGEAGRAALTSGASWDEIAALVEAGWPEAPR